MPLSQERPKPEEAPAPVSRRKMLLSTGGFMLLGVTAVGSIAKSGGTATASSAATDVRVRQTTAPRVPGVLPPPSPSPSKTEARQFRLATEPQYYVDDAGPMAIALTLDDGPDPAYTPQILAILDSYGIRATFNMIGEQVMDNLSLVREVSAAGHTITNHTWDHADMRAYSTSQVVSEIDACNDALSEAGQEPSIFRAPYGYWTPSVFEACAMRGLTPLGWSVDPEDWDQPRVTTQDIVRTVLTNTHAHDIILEHDGGGDRSNTVAALRIFIPELLARGFVFAAV